MANVRELLARLNPQTIKFDTGRGGVAELTNQDIAGALAFVPPGLGREVLEACWWPDGAALRRHKLRDAVIALVEPELRRQQRRLSEARTEFGLAEVCIGWAGTVTAQQREERERAAAKLARVRAECWPVSTLESLPSLAQAAIRELAGRSNCPHCEGRGEAFEAELLITCSACRGTGLSKVSDLSRANALKTDSRNYVRNWKPVYEWLLLKLADAESEAAKQLSGALNGVVNA
jgi:hypothetical protein